MSAFGLIGLFLFGLVLMVCFQLIAIADAIKSNTRHWDQINKNLHGIYLEQVEYHKQLEEQNKLLRSTMKNFNIKQVEF